MTAITCCKVEGDTLNALKMNAYINQQSNFLGKSHALDSDTKLTDFIYVTENCFTSNINIDRRITSLQSCRCEDNWSLHKCFCGHLSIKFGMMKKEN